MQTSSSTHSQPSEHSDRLLYQASGVSPVRMLQIIALAFAVAGLGLATMLLQAPPTVEPSPLGRAGAATFMGLFALSCPIVAWLYGRRVATRIWLAEDGRSLQISLISLLGSRTRRIALGDLTMTELTPGDPAGEAELSPRRLVVNVRGGSNFVVVFDRGSTAARQRLMDALRQERVAT